MELECGREGSKKVKRKHWGLGRLYNDGRRSILGTIKIVGLVLE